MEMDIEFDETEFEGKPGRAIYAWGGENLKSCAGHPLRDKRPADFATMPGDGRILIIFKRQSP